MESSEDLLEGSQAFEERRQQTLMAIDAYSSWISDKVYFPENRSLQWMCAKWIVDARCAHTGADLTCIEHTLVLSKKYAEGIHDIQQREWQPEDQGTIQ